MRQFLSVLIAGAVLSAPVVSHAQSTADFPNRPIRLVVGYLLRQRLTRFLGSLPGLLATLTGENNLKKCL